MSEATAGVRWAWLYLLAGLGYQAWGIYGTEFGVILRGYWERRGMSRVEIVVGAALGVLLWPLAIAIGLVMLAQTGAPWMQRYGRFLRRRYIDREGLPQPQMPVSKYPPCPTHGNTVRDAMASCARCGRPAAVFECGPCIREGVAIRLRPPLCTACFPPPPPLTPSTHPDCDHPLSRRRVHAMERAPHPGAHDTHVPQFSCLECRRVHDMQLDVWHEPWCARVFIPPVGDYSIIEDRRCDCPARRP